MGKGATSSGCGLYKPAALPRFILQPFVQSSVALESAEPPLTFSANLQEAETEIARYYT